MNKDLKRVKVGLALVLFGLLFGVIMGITFGINEDVYQNFIADGIAAHPTVHDAQSQDKIWRYAQRAHFHATGIAAFSLVLVVLVMCSDLTPKMKTASAAMLGLSSFYPFSWFTMFVLAPSIGRGPAHAHILTETFAYVGIGGLLLGSFLLLANLFFGIFGEKSYNVARGLGQKGVTDLSM